MSTTTISNTSVDSEFNHFLRSLMIPFRFPSTIPDNNMTQSIMKDLSLTYNFPVGVSRSGLLIFTPHSPDGVLRLFAWNSVLNRYMFHSKILPDQPIEDSYALSRFVSGGIRVKSSTISGSQFNIAGTFNASQYQFLPDLRTLTYNTIPSFSRGNSDKLLSIRVDEGVVALAYPDGNYDFLARETNGVHNITNLLDVAFTPTLAGPGQITTITPGLNGIPDNLTGWCELNFNVLFPLLPAGAVFTFQVFANRANPVNWDAVVVVQTEYNFSFVGNGNNYYAEGKRRFYVDGFISTIDFLSSAVYDLPTANIRFSNESYYSRGYLGPGCMIAFQSVTEDQEISIAGMLNYEAVPDSDLSREISTYSPRLENPMELEMAEYLIYNKETLNNGIRFLFTETEYSIFLSGGSVERITSLNRVVTTSGFGDFLKKIIGIATPLLGTLTGSLLGDESIGRNIGGTIGSLFGRGTYRTREPITMTGTYRNQVRGDYNPRTLRMAITYDPWFIQEITQSVMSAPVDIPLIEEGLPTELFDYWLGNSWYKPAEYGMQLGYRYRMGDYALPVTYNCNRAIGLDDKENTDIITVATTSVPLSGKQYKIFKYDVSGVVGEVTYFANVSISKDVMHQMAVSHNLAGQPSLFMHLLGPEGTELSGPSIGLAMYLSYNQISSPALFTGALSIDGKVVAISGLTAKMNAVRSGVFIVTPYDPEIENLQTLVTSHPCVYPYEAAAGVLVLGGRAPSLVFISDLGSLTLSAFISHGFTRYTPGQTLPTREVLNLGSEAVPNPIYAKVVLPTILTTISSETGGPLSLAVDEDFMNSFDWEKWIAIGKENNMFQGMSVESIKRALDDSRFEKPVQVLKALFDKFKGFTDVDYTIRDKNDREWTVEEIKAWPNWEQLKRVMRNAEQINNSFKKRNWKALANAIVGYEERKIGKGTTRPTWNKTAKRLERKPFKKLTTEKTKTPPPTQYTSEWTEEEEEEEPGFGLEEEGEIEMPSFVPTSTQPQLRQTQPEPELVRAPTDINQQMLSMMNNLNDVMSGLVKKVDVLESKNKPMNLPSRTRPNI